MFIIAVRKMALPRSSILKMDSKLAFGLAILASAFPFSEKLSGILVMAVLDIGKIPRSIP